MKLNGNELDIRLFILNQLYKTQGKISVIQSILKESKRRNHKFRRKLLTLFKENNFYVTDEMLREVINYIVVLVYRVKEEKKVKDYDVKFDLLKSYDEYFIARK